MKRIFAFASICFCFSLAFSADVKLAWDASASPDVQGYNLYRSTTQGSGYAKLNPSPIAGLTYTDTTAQQGATYYYVATAVRDGLESGYSNEVTYRVPWATPPDPPTNLTLVQQGANNLLQWDPVPGVDRYIVEFANSEIGGWWMVSTVDGLSYQFKAHPKGSPRFVAVRSLVNGQLGDRAVVAR